MKCISKRIKRGLGLFLCTVLLLTGCGSSAAAITNPYPLSDSHTAASSRLFAADLCVTDAVNYGNDQVSASLAESAGVFDLTSKEVLYSQNLFQKIYPASTTKILTAYIVIRSCGLDDEVTVSADALKGLQGSSTCGLAEGDVLTVRQLLYGLLLVSGNDAANVLAEHCSGSIEAFAEEMNQTAVQLGATASHFVNANGLPDEKHYTTAYDMYLIFQAAVGLQDFVDIIQTKSYTASYKNAAGETVEKEYGTTNRYLSGAEDAPDGITVIGGKTGTTNAAGYCLVLYAQNQKGDDLVGMVFKAQDRSSLYTLMGQILSSFAN